MNPLAQALRALLALALIAVVMTGGLSRASAAHCPDAAAVATAPAHHPNDAAHGAPFIAFDPNCPWHGCCATLEAVAGQGALRVAYHAAHAIGDGARPGSRLARDLFRPPRG